MVWACGSDSLRTRLREAMSRRRRFRTAAPGAAAFSLPRPVSTVQLQHGLEAARPSALLALKALSLDSPGRRPGVRPTRRVSALKGSDGTAGWNSPPGSMSPRSKPAACRRTPNGCAGRGGVVIASAAVHPSPLQRFDPSTTAFRFNIAPCHAVTLRFPNANRRGSTTHGT